LTSYLFGGKISQQRGHPPACSCLSCHAAGAGKYLTQPDNGSMFIGSINRHMRAVLDTALRHGSGQALRHSSGQAAQGWRGRPAFAEILRRAGSGMSQRRPFLIRIPIDSCALGWQRRRGLAPPCCSAVPVPGVVPNRGDRHLRGEKHAATEPVPFPPPVADRSRPRGLRNRLSENLRSPRRLPLA